MPQSEPLTCGFVVSMPLTCGDAATPPTPRKVPGAGWPDCRRGSQFFFEPTRFFVPRGVA